MINDFLKNAEDVQNKVKLIQKQLETTEVTGVSGGGVVEVKMTGLYSCKKITFKEGFLIQKKEIIEDIVAAAVNQALEKIKTLHTKSLETVGESMEISENIIR